MIADHIIVKAEEEICQHADRLSSGPSHKKPGQYHPYSQPAKQAPDIDQKSIPTAWKQLRQCEQNRKGRFDLKEGQVRPTLERWQTLNVKVQKLLCRTTSLVPDKVTDTHREASPSRSTPHGANTVGLKTTEGYQSH